MNRNVEIKARVEAIDAIESRVATFATQGPTLILQDDTFFPCASGRLKLRVFSASEGELIFYRRADQPSPKESFYVRAPTHDPDALRGALGLAYGEAGRVVKRRTLYLVGRTRVHLDRVQGLGDFVELEVVLREGEPTEAGVAEAHALMARLGIERSMLVESSYVDLLAAARRSGR
jgi:predicted adenylyl cyclase CyaB